MKMSGTSFSIHNTLASKDSSQFLEEIYERKDLERIIIQIFEFGQDAIYASTNDIQNLSPTTFFLPLSYESP